MLDGNDLLVVVQKKIILLYHDKKYIKLQENNTNWLSW